MLTLAALLATSTGCYRAFEAPDTGLDPGTGTTDPGTDTATDTDPGSDTATDTDPGTDTATLPPPDTIYDVQQGVVAPGETAVLEGVVVTGIAKLADGTGYGVYVQEAGGGQWSGVWAYTATGAEAFHRGQLVNLSGFVQEYDGSAHDWGNSITEIVVNDGTLALGAIAAAGSDVAEPAPEQLSVASLGADISAEPWEGALVRVQGALTVADGHLGFGEFSVDDGSGATIRVDDRLFLYGPVYTGDTFTAIQGVLDYSYGAWKIEPRDAADLQGWTSVITPITGVAAGDLVLSEIMADPNGSCTDSSDEWFEVYNASNKTIDIEGLIVRYGTSLKTVSSRILVAPQGYALFGAKNPLPCTSLVPDTTFSFALTNGAGKPMSLEKADGTVIDAVDLTAMAATPGASWGLNPTLMTATDNDNLANWCLATSALTTGNPADAEKGTPGAANDACI